MLTVREMVGKECSDCLTPSIVTGVPAGWGNTTVKEQMPGSVIEHRISRGIDPKQLGFSPIEVTHYLYPRQRVGCAPQIRLFPTVLYHVRGIKQDSGAHMLWKMCQKTRKLLETRTRTATAWVHEHHECWDHRMPRDATLRWPYLWRFASLPWSHLVI